MDWGGGGVVVRGGWWNFVVRGRLMDEVKYWLNEGVEAVFLSRRDILNARGILDQCAVVERGRGEASKVIEVSVQLASKW